MSYVPLTHRFLVWLKTTKSIPPVLAGFAIGITFALLVFGLQWYSGVLDGVLAGEESTLTLRATITLYVLLGYVPMAQYYLRTWSAEHIATIGEHFDLTAPSDELPRFLLKIFGICGSVSFYFLFFHNFNDPLFVLKPSNWSSDFVLPLVGGFFLGWFNLRFLFELWWHAVTISRTVPQIERLDLLNAAAVKPFAQQGVRSSLLAVGLLSISANLWLDPESPVIGSMAMLVTYTVGAILVVVLPTWKIHLRMRDVKHTQLAEIRAAIRRRSNPDRSVADAQQLRADLALERRVMDAGVWPMDAGSYGRVVLYIMLGLGSWIGAALVERLLAQTF